MHKRQVMVAAAILAALPFLTTAGFAEEPAKAPQAPAVATTLKPVSKIVVYFDEKAKDNGAIVFNFTPTGGEMIPIRVTIAKGMRDGEAAKAALKEFQVALGDEKYSFDVSAGVKVSIKGRKKQTFTMTIGEMSVPGLIVQIR